MWTGFIYSEHYAHLRTTFPSFVHKSLRLNARQTVQAIDAETKASGGQRQLSVLS